MKKELCFYVWLLKRDKMICNNIGLVPFTYNEFFRRSCDPKIMEDLIQVGYLGLIKAVDNFEESRNVKFSVFATNIIKQYMIVGVKNMTFALGTRTSTIRELNALPFSHFDSQDESGEDVNIIEIKYYKDEDVKLDDMFIKIYNEFKNSLSELDLAILERLEKGMRQVNIAEELHRTKKTVSIHKTRMQNKLKTMLL